MVLILRTYSVGYADDSFGVAALVLNLIPAVSVLFTCTTAIGAALWASDIEGNSPKKSGRDEL